MCMSVLPICMCVLHIYARCPEVRALEMKLQVTMSQHVGGGSLQALNHSAISLALLGF